ncbi:MAG TPA: hypothetical protein VK604_14980 [Bryobacteraceae bacterium]|nr:hypothetical protein [Bryobacteraceae bacterium]
MGAQRMNSISPGPTAVTGERSPHFPAPARQAAPPVYRPQASASQTKASGVRLQPPPVYRPQAPASQTKASRVRLQPPPVYRPQPPPVYRPQPLATQRKLGVNSPLAPGRLAPPVYRPQGGVQPMLARPAVHGVRPTMVNTIQPSWRGILTGGAVGLGIAAAAAATLATGGVAAIAAGGLASLGTAALTATGAYLGHSAESSAESVGEVAASGLDRGLAEGAEAAIEVLSPWKPVFYNMHGPNFLHELQEFQNHQQQVAHIPDEAFICRFDTNLVSRNPQHAPVNFRRLVRSRRKFLWTFDVGGILSIGSPQHNKHAIVADNAQLYAAGTGSIKSDPRIEQYLYYLDLERKAQEYRSRGITDRAENPYIEDAARNKIPKPPGMDVSQDIVVLDFDSGHYHPHGAWKAAYEAWAAAGFHVEKSSTGRTV